MLEAIHFQYFLGGLVSALLVITNPLSKLPLFVSLTQGMSEERRRQQANWAGIYAGIIMAVSLVGGNMLLLAFFGISYGAMRISGGLVVATIGYQMLFGGSSPNKAPIVRRDKDDYAFFPIAMPGIAGPGTIAVVIGFSTEIAELSNYADIAIAFELDGPCDHLHGHGLLGRHALLRHPDPRARPLRHARAGQAWASCSSASACSSSARASARSWRAASPFTPPN